MKIRVIAIGDELLNGQVTDTNSGFIARSLLPYGWSLEGVDVIHDDPGTIKSAVDRAFGTCDVIVTSGGLGPTRDDMTKKVMLELFGGSLVRNAEVTENIERLFAQRNIKINSLTADQALVPSSCEVIQNRYGTAPVMWFEREGKTLVALPGVPYELQGCWTDEVLQRLLNKYHTYTNLRSQTLIVTGITESALAMKLEEYEDTLPAMLHLAYLPNRNYIRLRLDGVSADKGKLDKEFDSSLSRLKDVLGSLLIYSGDATPAEILLSLLEEKKLTFGCAESCTGGSIAAAMTAIPGSSASFLGGVVAYGNDVKKRLLKVRGSSIESHGAVSREVVEEMARGARLELGCDCAVATSGIAGPSGGTEEKPVGTVWIAVAVPGAVESKCFLFSGSRSRVVESAVNTAILWMCSVIKEFKD